VIEYVDHLHEHFVDPVRIRNGRYLLPEAPGYSIEIYPESLDRYRYPDGAVWLEDSSLETIANGSRSNRDEM
jgi:L-fuconate dehydratase